MKLIGLILAVVLMAGTASAAPFLTYTPAASPSDLMPTHFMISVDAGPFEVIPGETLRYDMAHLTIGAHALFIRVCNQWGCREPVVKKIRKFLPEPLNENEFRIEER